MKAPSYREYTLLLDVGNVLFKMNPQKAWTKILKHSTHPNLSPTLFLHDGKLIEFQIGRIHTDQYFFHLRELLQVHMDLIEFQETWSSIFAPNEDIVTHLSQLAAIYKLGLLSNTNPAHVQFLERNFPEIYHYFPDRVYSHDIGFMKPRREIFLEAIKENQNSPEKYIFVDDELSYIKAAQELGLKTIHYTSETKLMQALEKISK